MGYEEAHLVCALYDSREEADRAVAALAEQGIEADVGKPGHRYHGLDDGTLEVRVPMGQVSRARVILAELG